ncbi:hypothetical protein AB7M47_005560 [Bradyrhizobium elkanii]|jgi:hypothetical protein|uniref:Uncharacterized protein n=1 Tax=Bradyrhizobium elkanii TaxID=29448 RepID=A0ABV4F2R2_BRAEL|nr:hypothetical protein [Bradyrhizobium elkanii]MCS4219831.1 hypothetical protein [Bradyrhizobium elkanii]
MMKLLNTRVDLATGALILMAFAFAGLMMGSLHP